MFGEQKIPYALIGGCSAIYYGSPYITRDVDFVVVPEKIDFELMGYLKKLGFEPTEEYEKVEELGAFGQFVHKETNIVLHIFSMVGGFSLKEGIEINEAEYGKDKIKICTVEDYLIMRASVWYEEDKQKAIVVIRAQGKNLNPDYLMKRADEEKVTERIKWLLKFKK
ncbi:MAG: hypothetical protein CVT89_02610 [Candidatus Altiarchaeales archaeon HGW-Altiarchaeales-2]|nr:MAG: hypothetical protein CVT89_02610 [Candidatus Altiarchaeales archaeon HGW-Altiarchaeales-2]